MEQNNQFESDVLDVFETHDKESEQGDSLVDFLFRNKYAPGYRASIFLLGGTDDPTNGNADQHDQKKHDKTRMLDSIYHGMRQNENTAQSISFGILRARESQLT